MRRTRFDFSYLVSAAALLAGAVTLLTGLIADVWDLNQFTIHSYAGYLAAGLVSIHVLLVGGRLVRYAGLYHYGVEDHGLSQIRLGDLRGQIIRHGLVQEFLGQANLVLVFTAIFQRMRWRYQSHTYRYALLEAGHLGQNVYLAAGALGFGACAIGAFLDDDHNPMLGVDGVEEAALYLLAVGKEKRG